MNTSPDLILAVPGTEEMEVMPRRVVREALQSGEMQPDRLVWSEQDQAWLPLQDVPHLLTKTDFLSYSPASEVQVQQEVTEPQAAVGSGAPARTPAPKTMKATAAVPIKTAQPKKMAKILSVKEQRSFPYLTLIAFLSFLTLAGLIGANYYFVEMPFQAALKSNSWNGDIITHANFGGFYQQDVIIVHLIPGPALTKANLLSSISTLAKSTPLPPGQTAAFKMVSITPGWLDAHYLIPSDTWAKLATMSGNDDQKKVTLIEHLQDLSGKPTLISDEHAVDLDKPDFAMDGREQKVWDQFVTTFVP